MVFILIAKFVFEHNTELIRMCFGKQLQAKKVSTTPRTIDVSRRAAISKHFVGVVRVRFGFTKHHLMQATRGKRHVKAPHSVFAMLTLEFPKFNFP